MSRPNLLGRLLAVLEYFGYAEPQLYQQACAEPACLIGPLSRVTAARGEEVAELLLPIVAQISSDAFESSLSDVAQSDFMLGYYHQRAELHNYQRAASHTHQRAESHTHQLAELRSRAVPNVLEEPPSHTERWDIQIEPDLKRWAIENGGSALVRVLLRQAREQQS
jgi:hypothetical protein